MRFIMLMLPKGYEKAAAGRHAGRVGSAGRHAGRQGRCRDDGVQRVPAERCCSRSMASTRPRWARASREAQGGPITEAKRALATITFVGLDGKTTLTINTRFEAAADREAAVNI